MRREKLRGRATPGGRLKLERVEDESFGDGLPQSVDVERAEAFLLLRVGHTLLHAKRESARNTISRRKCLFCETPVCASLPDVIVHAVGQCLGVLLGERWAWQ